MSYIRPRQIVPPSQYCRGLTNLPSYMNNTLNYVVYTMNYTIPTTMSVHQTNLLPESTLRNDASQVYIRYIGPPHNV